VGSRILSAAAAGVSPLAVAKILLKSDVWTSWFRPRAYDARMARALDDDLSRELQNADAIIDAVLRQPPPGVGDDHWCPRCAATYQAGFTTCAECDVPLEGGAAAASRNSKC
jgi:hypothetical protein